MSVNEVGTESLENKWEQDLSRKCLSQSKTNNGKDDIQNEQWKF
jgi:hypothetical protein